MMIQARERGTGQAARLKKVLWDAGDGLWIKSYAVLDAARGPEVYEVVRHFNPEHYCLFRGALSDSMRRAAPYLIDLKPDSEFTRDVLELGWGDAWGIFLFAPASTAFEELRRHLRRLLQVRDETGRKLFFRFYDPRVLRVYLPTCTPEEAHTFCGPVTRIVMEAAEPQTAIRYDRHGWELERSFRHL